MNHLLHFEYEEKKLLNTSNPVKVIPNVSSMSFLRGSKELKADLWEINKFSYYSLPSNINYKKFPLRLTQLKRNKKKVSQVEIQQIISVRNPIFFNLISILTFIQDFVLLGENSVVVDFEVINKSKIILFVCFADCTNEILKIKLNLQQPYNKSYLYNIINTIILNNEISSIESE